MPIAALNLGPLNDGESWDDLLTITLDRHKWAVCLAAVVQMGQQVCEGIEDMEAKAAKGDVLAALAAYALADSNDELRELSLGIIQVINPAMFAAVKADAQRHADA